MRLALALAAAVLLAAAAPAAGAPPPVEARAVLVENPATGEVLAAEDAHARVPIASITKLMTVLVTLDHARLGDVVVAPAQAAAVGESSIGLQPGERLTVRDLMEAALVQSANDAAWALALHVGGGDVDRFVAMMNARARQLGLRDTHFARPDGLDAPGHYSSAADVTRLARIAMRRPAVRSIVRRQTAAIAGNRTLTTWNDLLSSYAGTIGVKTGHTSEAGWSEVAAVRRPGVTLYATLLGSPSREQRNADLAALLTWGFGRYRYLRVVEPGRVYAHSSAPYGRGTVPLVAATAAYRAVRAGRPLVERVVAPATLRLPVRRGQAVGEVRVLSGGRVVARRPLVAARSVDRPGLAGRVGWYLSRAASHVGGWFS